jgi:taurine dioxygenase
VVDPIAWISNVEAGFHPEGELLFHSDYAFTAWPMLGLSLYAVELGAGAAPTNFASSAHAVATLEPRVREHLAALDVVHLIDAINGRDNVRTRLDQLGDDAERLDLYPRYARPAIWQHPITGVPLLFVMQQQASHFDGWSCVDSDNLLEAAFDALYADANVYEHEWRTGDFVVWDNLALQHGRRANPRSVRRSLRRVAMNTVTTAELIAGTAFDPEHRRSLESISRR